MKKLVYLGIAGLLSTTLIAAEGKDDVSSAVKKLTEKSYSWSTEVKTPNADSGGGRRFGGGPSTGKAANDYVYIKREVGQNTFEVARKGDKVAFTGQDGAWMSAEELAQRFQNQGGGAGGNMASRFAKSPAEEAKELLEKIPSLKKESDGSYSADLPEELAKTRINPFAAFRQNNQSSVSGAKGTAKFWVKDGVLSKYEVHLEGKFSFTRNGDTQERDVNSTTTTEIKDVGSTKVELPDEAKKKLS